MNNNTLISLEIERSCLSGLYNNASVFPEIDVFTKDTDFSKKLFQIIYSVIKKQILANKPLDKVLVAQAVIDLRVKTEDDISDIFSFIDAILDKKITPQSTVESFKSLVKFRILREICKTARQVNDFVKQNSEKPLVEIISETDKIYNDTIRTLYQNEEIPDIFETLPDKIESIGNNPPDSSKLMMGPFSTVNRLFGSLHKPASICVIGARSGVAKSSLGMFVNAYLADKYNIPILNLDFGEMLEDELVIRGASMLTGGRVPIWAIESGEFRKSAEWTKLLREAWPKAKKIKFYFKDVSKLSPSEIISLIRRFYYNKVGRGNQFLIHYDHLKPFDTSNYRAPIWFEMAKFIGDMKSFLKNECPVPFWCSLQLNRLGITNNKQKNQVDDSENSFAISDDICRQSTHSFIVRQKLLEEVADEQNQFGNLKMMCVKHRHLGRDFQLALNPVKTLDGKFEKNYINLNFNTFHFEDRGDLNDMVRSLGEKHNTSEENGELIDELL